MINRSLLQQMCDYCSPADICQPNKFASVSANCQLQLSFINTIINNFTSNDSNLIENNNEMKMKILPTPLEVYGIGLTVVTIINACAGLGIVFIPFMNKSFYQLIMTFMVALAVGSLAGSSLLILLPEGLGLKILSENNDLLKNYVWKCTACLGGIYGFFLIERMLRLMIENNTCCNKMMKSNENHNENGINETTKNANSQSPRKTSTSLVEIDFTERNVENPSTSITHGHAHHNGNIAPVAWMILMGDALHNFVDGLSIGAQFSQSIFLGITLSLAVMCEELPHELGDFAVLLNSGMSVKMAVGVNFLSALTCYMGFIVGALLGEMTDAANWIMIMSAGMFLYISLVDMMPEIIHLFESKQAHQLGRWKIFIIQNLGLLTGYTFLLIVTLYNPSNFF